DAAGRPIPALKALAPKGARRMSANPIANGGFVREPLEMGDFCKAAVDVKKTRATLARHLPTLRHLLPESIPRNMQKFQSFRARRDGIQPAPGHLRSRQEGMARRVLPGRRGRWPACSERSCHGDAQRAYRGRVARGLPSKRPAWPD